MYYILKDKTPVAVTDVIEWGKWFEAANRVVKQTTLPDGTFISTVFLGLNHNYSGGQPLLFETMIFNSNENREDYQERYTTWEQAEEGHQKAIELVFQL